MEAPPTNQVFQTESSITFSWSSAADAEPTCNSNPTTFVYIFSIWDNTAIQTSTPIFTKEIPVSFHFFTFLFFVKLGQEVGHGN